MAIVTRFFYVQFQHFTSKQQNKSKNKSNECCLNEKRFYICEPINHKKNEIMKAIVNRTKKFGTVNGVIQPNETILKIINQHLKLGTAKILIDTDETLMYQLNKI